MKKTYITPEMLVTRINISHNLLNGSPTVQITNNEATTVDGDNTTYDTLGRRSVWGDEE